MTWGPKHRRGPYLFGDERSIRLSLRLPIWVRAELDQCGGVSTTGREVLIRWAERQRAGEDSDLPSRTELLEENEMLRETLAQLRKLCEQAEAACGKIGGHDR